MKKTIICLIALTMLTGAITANATPVPRESAPCNATEHQIIVAENYISEILDEVKNGMGFADAKAEFDARVKIYQSVNPAFNPDEEFAKDTCYRDIPSVDNSLFTIARKLILEAKK